MTVMLAPTSVAQTTLGQHDVALLHQLILSDTVRGSAGLTNVSQHQKSQSQMPSQAYANQTMGPPQMNFSFPVEPPADSLCHFLVSVMVQLLGFAT